MPERSRERKPDAAADVAPLVAFTNAAREFVAAIGTSYGSATTGDDAIALNRAYAGALNNQLDRLGNYLVSGFADLALADRQGIVELLSISSMEPALRSAMPAAQAAPSEVTAIGLGGLVREIKKLIKKIFDLFWKNRPKWVDAIIDVIDQILNLLLGGVFPGLRRELSSMEVDFLQELHAARKLELLEQRYTADVEID